MPTAFLSGIFCLVLVDLFLHRNIGSASVVLFYIAFRAQADSAAARFLRQTLKDPSRVPFFFFQNPEKPKPQKPRDTEERTAKIFYLPRGARPEAPPKGDEPEERATMPPPPRRPRAVFHPAPYRAPNFQGPAHEVLGIEENAATAVIIGAFRHWIKRHHPDHAAPQLAAKATDRARRLTEAKEILLDRRKRLRAVA